MKIARLFLPLLTVLLLSCSRGEKGYLRMEGHLKHLQNAQFFVYSDSPDFNRVDTLAVVAGDFQYRTPLSEPTVMTLVYPNFSETLFIAEPGQVLRYEAEVSNLRHASITGSEANDSLTAFRQRYATQSPERQQKAAEEFIRRYPQNMASLALFQKYFEHAEVVTLKPTRELLKALLQAHPAHQGLQALNSRMTALLSTAVGATTQLQASTLYIFTSVTQSQSNELRRVAQQAMTESDYSLVDVKIDEHDLDSLRQQYGMRYVPGWILVDKNRKVKARDLSIARLTAELKKK